MEKIRSKSWVGSIYHKFEAMCQEVDEFVTKDTVKYVENQVQTVGESMKKISGVVQDFLITKDNPVKRDTRAVSGNQKHAGDPHTNSETGTSQNLIKKQLSLNQGDTDNSLERRNCSTSTELDGVEFSEEAEIDLHIGNDCTSSTCESSGKVFEMNITREEELLDEESSSSQDRLASEYGSNGDSEDTMCYSFSDDERCFPDVSSCQIVVQDGVVRKEQPMAEGSSSVLDNLSESRLRACKKDEKMMDSSPDSTNCISTSPSSQMVMSRNIRTGVQSVSDQSNSFGQMALPMPLQFSMEGNHVNPIMAMCPDPTSLDIEHGTSPEDERGCIRFSDAAKSISSVAITNTISQSNITINDQLAPQESTSTTDESIQQPPVFPSKIPPTSLNDAEIGVSMAVCNCVLDDVSYVSAESTVAGAFEDAPNILQSSELVLSPVVAENESVNVHIAVPNSSVLAESSNLSNSSIGNCMQEPDSDSSISGGLSSSLSTHLVNSDRVVSVIPALSSTASLTDSIDVNSSCSRDPVGNALSTENNLEWHPSPQLKVLMSPTKEIGCLSDCLVDLPCMETIDLTDERKLEESCILVDNKLHTSVSFRPRKYKSYKELIREAFASRKRLIKEYKQLAVWYADVDAETSKRAELSQFPSFPPPYLHSTESTRNICESEWELL